MNQKEQKIRYAIQKAIKELNSAPSDSSAPPTDLYQEVNLFSLFVSFNESFECDDWDGSGPYNNGGCAPKQK